MAKKKSNTTKKKITASSVENKGFITFDLLSDETFNPVLKEKEEADREKADLAQTREYMREASWIDVIQGVLNYYPQQHSKSELAVKKKHIPYEQLSKFTIKNAYFMVLQGYSHLYPGEAAMLNNKYINEVDATNVIRSVMSSRVTKYTKNDVYWKFWPMSLKDKRNVKYTKSDGTESQREIELDDVKDFCKSVNWSLTDYNMYCELYSKEEADELVCQFIDKSTEKPPSFIKLKKSEMNAYDDDVDHSVIKDNSQHIVVNTETSDGTQVQLTVSNGKLNNDFNVKVDKPIKSVTVTTEVNSLFSDDNMLFSDVEPNKSEVHTDVSVTPLSSQEVKQTQSVSAAPVQQSQQKAEPKITMPPIIHTPSVEPVQQQQSKPHKIEIDQNAPIIWQPVDLHIIENIC